jgi:ATP-dependent RNA helicase RhlE
VVGTPGRILDHLRRGSLDLKSLGMLVLDEADRMLDMGFINDIRRVLKLLPRKRQNLMFSATYSDDIRGLAQGLLHNPVEIEVAKRNAVVESVEQHAYFVAKENKRALLSHLIREGDWSQVLVFTRTKHGANRLTKQLEEDGIDAAAIHGNKSQSARTQALANFKSGKIRALVATEVAARGLDIKELPHVVNYELPNVPEDYVHRIGRTGRAGATGIALSLVSHDESGLLRDVERVLGKRIAQIPVPVISAAPPPRAPRFAESAPQQNHQRRDRQGAQRRHSGARSGAPGQSGRGPQRQASGSNSGSQAGRQQRRP